MHLLGIDAGADAGNDLHTHGFSAGLSAHAVEIVHAVENDRQPPAERLIPQLRVLIHGGEGDAFQTGPQAKEASPMLQTTMPGLRFTRLKSAAPGAIEPEPPTIALLGEIPNGGKNACIEPPSPRLNPASRAKISQ